MLFGFVLALSNFNCGLLRLCGDARGPNSQPAAKTVVASVLVFVYVR